MMREEVNMPFEHAYYYDRGRKVTLTPDETMIVVDTRRAATLLSAGQLEDLKRQGDELLFDLLLLNRRDHLSVEVVRTLEGTAALLPVYAFGGTWGVALPEVLVSADKRLHAQIQSMIGDQADLTSPDGSTLMVRPKSGKAEDALAIGRLLVEKLERVSASPNFLRLT
jgi:hypothetical protein